MTVARVTLIFESADGTQQETSGYDTDTYEGAVSSGQHDDIIAKLMPSVRRALGDDARLAKVLLDGVEQPGWWEP